MSHPYSELPERAFWAQAVGRRDALDIDRLWTPKWPIAPTTKIATYGSCFAQHFGRALAQRDYHWMLSEVPPAELSVERAKALNFGVFSARTGNIYTASLLHQWVRWALGEQSPQTEIWEKDGRFFDPFRPAIEPGGFDTSAEMLASREMTIEAFGKTLRECNVFVFTLGLTESWWNAEMGHEYPMCPGTAAGTFDPDLHKFQNQPYNFISSELRAAIRAIRSVNPKVRILFTVSPVPLTATMSGAHVLVATSWSKSVLRAVAGSLADAAPFIDYFPSFEIISSAPFQGRFYSANKRSVEQDGVNHVMAQFFADMARAYPALARNTPLTAGGEEQEPVEVFSPQTRNRTDDAAELVTEDDLVCEEALLAAFATDKGA